MTDQQPYDRPLADEPIPGTEEEAGGETGGSARSREWLGQLEAMIQEIATQAAPVARQVGAKAAELAAVAAVKAGPLAQKAAEVTTDYGQRFAERAQSVAAELRREGAEDAEAPAGDAVAGGTGEPGAGPSA